MRAVIAQYAKVRANLALHDRAYPSAPVLRSLIGSGQPVYGMAGVGPGKDTDGSRRLVAALSKADDRPLWVSVWGGPNTLAQALHTIRTTRPPSPVRSATEKRSCSTSPGSTGRRPAAVCRTALALAPHFLGRSHHVGDDDAAVILRRVGRGDFRVVP